MSASIRLQLFMVATTIVAFLAALGLNLWLLPRVEYIPGIGWIYLPAGVRLLCTLLFAEAGAVGFQHVGEEGHAGHALHGASDPAQPWMLPGQDGAELLLRHRHGRGAGVAV